MFRGFSVSRLMRISSCDEENHVMRETECVICRNGKMVGCLRLAATFGKSVCNDSG